jgi:hypothetical protein
MLRNAKQLDSGSGEKLEALLREQPAALLSPQFQRNVLAAVSRLPEPALLASPARGRDLLYALRLLSTGERIGLGLALCALVALALPSVSDALALAEWDLADFTVSFSIGGTALSASLLSVLAVALGVVFMAAVGAFASRNHLLGA